MSQTESAIAKVSTGLKEPIQALPSDLDSPLPVLISDHVKDQWHRRVLPDRPRRAALVELVEILEAGTEVKTRRSPYRWVRSSRNNSLYLAVGRDIILPAEPVRGSAETLEVTTCMTNPASKHPLGFRRRPKAPTVPTGRKRR